MIGVNEAAAVFPRLNALAAPMFRPAARRDRRLVISSLIVIDALALGLAMTIASLLRVRLDEVLPVTALDAVQHLLVSIVLVPVMLLLFRFQDLYDLDQILVGTREYSSVVRAATYGAFVALALSYAAGQPLVSRSWLPLVWLLSITCVSLGRFAARRVVRGLRHRGFLRTRVAIVGASSFGVAIAEQLRAARHEGLDVVGFLDEYLPLGQRLLDDLDVIGRPSDLLRPYAPRIADEYILVQQALPHERQEQISRLMLEREGPIVRIAISSRDMLTHGVQLIERGSVPLVRLEQARLRGLEAMLKTTLDRGLASLALIVLAPLALAAIIRGYLSNTRPLLCRSSIFGNGGTHSTLWLFNYDIASWPPLRGLPALVAVLRGELSLVGPRPVLSGIGDSADEPLWLTAVKPGLTGPWRLGDTADSLQDQALRDLAYVRNYSIWEDLRILTESLHRLGRGSLPTLLGRWDSAHSIHLQD